MGSLGRMTPAIDTPRLQLRPIGPPALSALLAGDRAGAARMLGCAIPEALPIEQMPLAMRLEQLRVDPSLGPWLVRAIVERASQTMIGHIGFHTAPRPAYLAAIAPDGVELGYSIHAPFRRRGHATEAAIALMRWAFDQHGQRAFVLSISPENVASTAMATKLGFEPCGSHIDEEDGLEIEFVRRFDAWPDDWDG